jgi:hypothetical protein
LAGLIAFNRRSANGKCGRDADVERADVAEGDARPRGADARPAVDVGGGADAGGFAGTIGFDVPGALVREGFNVPRLASRRSLSLCLRASKRLISSSLFPSSSSTIGRRVRRFVRKLFERSSSRSESSVTNDESESSEVSFLSLPLLNRLRSLLELSDERPIRALLLATISGDTDIVSTHLLFTFFPVAQYVHAMREIARWLNRIVLRAISRPPYLVI